MIMVQCEKYIKTIGIYSSLVIISILSLACIMQLWRADIHVPFQYDGDSIMTGEWVKSIIDNGWFLDNKYIGMPTGKNLRDVPMSDNFHYAIIKIITLFTDDYAAAMNIFYIFTFPLIVCTSFYVFRKFSISPFLSFFGAFLYAFLEYHYARNLAHIFLSAYYMNPLIIMVILWLFSGTLEITGEEATSRKFVGSINQKFRVSMIISLLVSACGIYYAYFSCFLLLTAGAVRSIWQKKFRPIVTAVVLTAIITIGGVLNLSPVILYQLQNGKNPEASARVYHEAELYSLKITELLLPVTGHRIKTLASLKDQHERETSFIYRFYKPKIAASLGIIGSMGFIFLLGFLIVYRKNNENILNDIDRHNLLLYLSILTIAALLMATVGGFDSIVAHIIRYKIRAYERLSIFIAFFALFAVLVIIQNFYDTYIKNRHTPVIRFNSITLYLPGILFHIFMTALLMAGLFDQAGIFSTPDYDTIKKKFLDDKKFTAHLERVLPCDSMIFQLPYIAYPESVHPYKMIDYDHLRFYLHTTKLRWSYGTVKGRSGDKWQKEAASKPAADMIKEIAGRGFKGIFINRNGYKDNGEKIIQEIKNILLVEPITSDDNSIVFFSMTR
jgi:phosphoglycerol transferase